jgi:hypothetical protein
LAPPLALDGGRVGALPCSRELTIATFFLFRALTSRRPRHSYALGRGKPLRDGRVSAFFVHP